MKKLILFFMVPFLGFGQQSKNYKARPDNVIAGHVKTGDQLSKESVVLIPNVPSYLWHRGCGPTCLGMVVGYYDNLGYQDLIPGFANFQNEYINSLYKIGNVAKSNNSHYTSKNIFHFEIWGNNKKLNPEKWLKKKK